MLYSTIHHPSIYNISCCNTSDDLFYYSNVLAILRDAYKNCILLIDKNNDLLDRIKKHIDKWPEDYRVLAKKLLKQIYTKNRIISVDSAKCSVINEDCKNDDCNILQNIINCYKDIVIVLSKCPNCIHNVSGEIIELEKYQLSNFVNKKRRLSYTISYNDRTPSDYANQIFIPIFKYCNAIKIIDRLIGSHISSHPGNLRANYKRGLDFLAECISISGNKNVIVELYTSILLPKPLYELDSTEISSIRSTIHNIESFVDKLNKKYNLSIKTIFKDDKTDFVHDRFIITDQIGIYIGRGFDLLDANKKVNDNTIGLLDSYNSVEVNIRSLTDLKSAI